MHGLQINSTDPMAFQQELQAMAEDSGGSFSLFVVDIGNIGKIFARLGYKASNRFLHQIARLMEGFCRDRDRVSRIGDNTFGVMLSGIHSPGHATLAAEKLLRLHKEMFAGAEATYRRTLRIGIANYPDHADNPSDLMHKARIALETAHTSGKSYVAYSRDAAQSLAGHWELQDELTAAIAAESLELYYQPKICTVSGRPTGAEALLRWHSEKHGSLSPDIFIPVATEIGLMKKLTWLS